MKHELKTDPAVFIASQEGDKSFEIRLNDRGYQIGDHLLLRETKHSGEEMKAGKPLAYTGREYLVRVKYILSGYGLKEDWVIMSVVHVPEGDTECPVQ